MIEVFSCSEDETISLGIQIAKNLKTGSVVALEGTLGSGKTYLSKGIALGLGIEDTITSPTFTIINEYKRDSLPSLYHIDVYRLNNENDFEEIGAVEIINSGGISIIEWSERVKNYIPKDAITISIQVTEEAKRKIIIKGLSKL